MKLPKLLFFIVIILFTIGFGWSIAPAQATTQLPITASNEYPAILLELGNKPSLPGLKNKKLRVFTGELIAHEGDTSIQNGEDDISSLHPDFGSWKVSFRFKIEPVRQTTPLLFWARWRQGGDPNVCTQTFEIWAGSDPNKMELRATLAMNPKGWEYAWIAGNTLVNLKEHDTLIEIRNSGAGHDAKVFDAFLLASPLSTLPTNGTTEKPSILLELGNTPLLADIIKDPALRMYTGEVTNTSNADSTLTEKDEVQVLHQGFGSWDANFNFELNPEIMPGQYRFFARYKSGGEVSQVKQNFTIKSGAKPNELATRGDFSLTNTSPWEYQWLQAEGTVTLLPGDRFLEISNTGKADGAKVFDAFLLKLESPLGTKMDIAQAQLRNKFLALTKKLPHADKHLYLLDGNDESNEILFRGLTSAPAQTHYDTLSVKYFAGSEAEALARQLNIKTLPSALITDNYFSLLGQLSQPKNEQEVARFLAEPHQFGTIHAPTPMTMDNPAVLTNGRPQAWLVGGLQDGLAGMSVFGLDSETTLRPNPDQPYLSLQMMGGALRHWQVSPTQADGSVDIEASTQHAYGWSRGTGYAQLYLYSDQAEEALLHLKQSGIKTQVWLDGQEVTLTDDPQPPFSADFSAAKLKAFVLGLTTEGLLATALSERPQNPQLAQLKLETGWHSLLIKLVMQHDQNQRFYFSSQFTDHSGKPISDLKTQLSDPHADLSLNKTAAKLRPLIFVNAPANLPHPGETVKLKIDLRWHPILEEPNISAPLPRFQAKLRIRLVDYQGNEITHREIEGLFPNEIEVDLGKASVPGYYAVYPSLYNPDGKLIMHYPADGFSVVRGNVEQQQRLEKKKLWNNNYYALADGDNSFQQVGGYFSWLQRMGIYKSYGSYPGFEPQYQAKWEQARKLGLQLFADASGDSNWLNDNPTEGEKFIQQAAKYTRFFKSTNEIDIRNEPEWQQLREPKHWVERAHREYEQIHKQRSDAHYVGGSLVRPGDNQAAGQWFKAVLELGLDKYHDAWDVHAYPQQSPRLEGTIGNSEAEDERGVLATYASLGRKNTLPFWLGETGAKAMHGLTGRRWQAEQVAKMIAWTNSRTDYLGLAFCIGHEYDLAYGRIWDYSMGHKPGEAALYTASALIDGLPYKAIDTRDPNIQSAYFGETLMIWRTDENTEPWQLKLTPDQSWVVVDVVGHTQDLTVNAEGTATILISASPVYVLAKSEYERLTRFQ